MMDKNEFISPKLINVNSIGDSEIGFISIVQADIDLPFQIKRAYWTYGCSAEIMRGSHAHKSLFQLIVAVSGKIDFHTINRNGQKQYFSLSSPNVGLLIPPLVWRDIKFMNDAVLLCLASEVYIESDYIRELKDFEAFIGFLKKNIKI